MRFTLSSSNPLSSCRSEVSCHVRVVVASDQPPPQASESHAYDLQNGLGQICFAARNTENMWNDMDRETFLNDDNWLGSYYELCLELGPTGDDGRLKNAVAHLWSRPQLDGSWTDRASCNENPPPIEFSDGFIPPRYGIITLTSGDRLGCVTHTVRETDGSDWLDLCIPTGMLELVFDTHYPLCHRSRRFALSSAPA